MADIVDDAQAAMEAQEELLRATRKAQAPIRTGFCLECETPTEWSFCCSDCRDMYEKRAKMRAITGK